MASETQERLSAGTPGLFTDPVSIKRSMSHAFALHNSVVDGSESSVLRVHFDRQSPVPLYRQLKFHIAHAISMGRLLHGAQLPSVRVAGKTLNLAPATVQKAYAELQRDGFITSDPGRGAFVARLESPPHSEGAEVALRDLLMPTILQARLLGFDPHDIETTVKRLLPLDSAQRLQPRVVFVGRNEAIAKKFVELLSQGLAGVPCELLPVDFTTLERPGALDDFMPVHMLVSMVSQFPRVREVGDRYGVHSYGLTIELNDQTKSLIMAIPVGAKIGLITDSMFLSNTQATVESLIWTPHLVAVASEDADRARAKLADREWILHTQATTEMATDVAPPGSRLISLEPVPMPASVAHLAQLLHAIQRDELNGAPQQQGT